MIINKEKRFAKKLTKLLNKRGFLVTQHNSRKSKSIYLTIDNGVIPTIRISDHKRFGNNGCKYNVIRNYTGEKCEFIKGKIRKYYQFANIGRLIADIETERSNKVIKIGYYDYKTIRDGKNKIVRYLKPKSNKQAA